MLWVSGHASRHGNRDGTSNLQIDPTSMRSCRCGARLIWRVRSETGPSEHLAREQSLHGRGLLNAIVPYASYADGPIVEGARSTTPFGLTSGAPLVTVALHSGVFVGRQYAAFAGITHGQKVHDFIETLLTRRERPAVEKYWRRRERRDEKKDSEVKKWSAFALER